MSSASATSSITSLWLSSARDGYCAATDGPRRTEQQHEAAAELRQCRCDRFAQEVQVSLEALGVKGQRRRALPVRKVEQRDAAIGASVCRWAVQLPSELRIAGKRELDTQTQLREPKLEPATQWVAGKRGRHADSPAWEGRRHIWTSAPSWRSWEKMPKKRFPCDSFRIFTPSSSRRFFSLSLSLSLSLGVL